MKLVVWQKYLGGKILYRSLESKLWTLLKKRRHIFKIKKILFLANLSIVVGRNSRYDKRWSLLKTRKYVRSRINYQENVFTQFFELFQKKVPFRIFFRFFLNLNLKTFEQRYVNSCGEPMFKETIIRPDRKISSDNSTPVRKAKNTPKRKSKKLDSPKKTRIPSKDDFDENSRDSILSSSSTNSNNDEILAILTGNFDAVFLTGSKLLYQVRPPKWFF